jgi:hypothetical protein
MEAIETNLAGINLVMTRQTETMEEGNKTMTGLGTGLNKMKKRTGGNKNRQNKCEWKREAWEEEAKGNNLINNNINNNKWRINEDT